MTYIGEGKDSSENVGTVVGLRTVEVVECGFNLYTTCTV